MSADTPPAVAVAAAAAAVCLRYLQTKSKHPTQWAGQ
jgi:hypothetical protein